MNTPFQDKVALVTGAAGGIGRASAMAFARQKAKVVAADIDVKGGQETVELIKGEGAEAVFISVDVTNSREVKSLIDQIVSRYGQLDYAHNNAGIEGKKATLVEQTEEDWDRLIDINLKGIWLCMKYEIPAMLRNESGAIVNTGSVSSELGLKNYSPYCASKHGIIGLTKTAALEFIKHNIRVNAVCPGLIDTEMISRSIVGETLVDDGITGFFQNLKRYVGGTMLKNKQPSGRMGLAEEVAEAVVWLCSEKASFVNGHALVVDGGLMVK